MWLEQRPAEVMPEDVALPRDEGTTCGVLCERKKNHVAGGGRWGIGAPLQTAIRHWTAGARSAMSRQ